MGVSQFWDAMVKLEAERNLYDPPCPPYKPPRGHDKELTDSERAHSGKTGHKVRHGADALGIIPTGTKQNGF